MAKIVDTLDYDMIPDRVLGGKLLEIGPGKGVAQLNSLKADYFKQLAAEQQWLGVDRDINMFEGVPYLGLGKTLEELQIDHFERESFDLVIMSHVLEHIDIRNWLSCFDKILNWMKPGAYLLIAVPYKECMYHVMKAHDLRGIMDHCVFDIDEKLLDHFFSQTRVKLTVSYLKYNRWYFRSGNELLLRSIARFIRRVIVGNYFVNAYLPRRRVLMAIVRKQ